MIDFECSLCPLCRIFWLNSRLAGPIPVELGRLVVLKSLDISSNGLTGKYGELPGRVYQQAPPPVWGGVGDLL